MNLAFTLCSINYLAQAHNLYNSIQRTNPDWKFVIGVVDRNTKDVDLSGIPCEIVWVDALSIDGFGEMVDRYTIVELLTSVKPFYFEWLMNRNPEMENIVYFDPDIMVLRSLDTMAVQLKQYDILLTPHMTTPIEDNLLPKELHVKQTGIYNLGFLAIHRTDNSMAMLHWWQRRLRDLCLIELSRGLFVDQLWMDLVPVYFDKVLIDKNPGYNMAHWNLHERRLVKNPDGYYVNGRPLVFYHFSHYSPSHPGEIAAYHTRFSFATRPDIVELYETYKQGLVGALYFELKKIPCYYVQNEQKKRRKRDWENFLRMALPKSVKGKIKSLLKK